MRENPPLYAPEMAQPCFSEEFSTAHEEPRGETTGKNLSIIRESAGFRL
jgi:hypothetical protein